MKRFLLVAVAATAALAAPAIGQTPEEKAKKVTRAAKMITGPDVAVVKEAQQTVKAAGECETIFTVGLDGKAKDIKPNCTPADYNDWVVKAMAPVTYTVELFLGEAFETENLKQPFRFGAAAATVKQAVVVPPKATKELDREAISRAVAKVKKPATCAIVVTVSPAGDVSKVVPGCDVEAYNDPITKAVSAMKFSPATKDGQAVEWTINMTLPLGQKKL